MVAVWAGLCGVVWVLGSSILARVGVLQSSLHARVGVLAMVIFGQVWVGFKLWSSVHAGVG